MTAIRKTVLRIGVAFLLLVVFVFVVGGYWENVPILNRISGPMRLRQFVVDPLPDFISNVRGGYSGFPRGAVVVRFDFHRSSSSWDFLSSWVASPCLNDLQGYVPEINGPTRFVSYADTEPNHIRTFVRLSRDKSMSTSDCRREPYLIIDERNQRAALVQPAG
jgi:hypothetical protein